MTVTEGIWIAVGAGGQACFGLRMLVQLYASEREGRSVVPPVFWHISLGGSLMMLSYAIWRMDPVFIFGQSLPLPVYIRNVVLLAREKHARPAASSNAPTGPRLAPGTEAIPLATASQAPAECSCPCTCGARRAA
jgi:lipid-A-disaccharide synthase-like uncharacterized protein